MALTKAEAAKLTNDMFLRGVIETVIYESPILQMLPFMEVTGTALTYNRESTVAVRPRSTLRSGRGAKRRRRSRRRPLASRSSAVMRTSTTSCSRRTPIPTTWKRRSSRAKRRVSLRSSATRSITATPALTPTRSTAWSTR